MVKFWIEVWGLSYTFQCTYMIFSESRSNWNVILRLRIYVSIEFDSDRKLWAYTQFDDSFL